MHICVVGDSMGDVRTGAERQALVVADELARRFRPSSVSLILPRQSWRARVVSAALGRVRFLWRHDIAWVSEVFLRLAGERRRFGVKDGAVCHKLILLGAGSRSAAWILAWAAVNRGLGIATVQVLNPRIVPHERFNAVLCPIHDTVRIRLGPNAISFVGSIPRFQPWQHPVEITRWMTITTSPRVVVLIGGPRSRITETWACMRDCATKLAKRIHQAVPSGTVFISSSRRSPPSYCRNLLQGLKELDSNPNKRSYFLYDGGESFNPYSSWLSLADIIIVTSDSVNMITEAMMTTATVLTVNDSWAGSSQRLFALHRNLREAQFTTPLTLALGIGFAQDIEKRNTLLSSQVSSVCERLITLLQPDIKP